MRFSTILFPLAILASFVVASPITEEPRSPVPVEGDNFIEKRGDHAKITAVHSAAAPKYEAVHVIPNPGVKDNHVEGTGVTAKLPPGKSKRSDYNELDGRATPYATLVVCTGYGCRGSCYGYYLPVSPYWCYWVHWYNSLYVRASDGLTYGVFVGDYCWWGMFFFF